MDPAAEAAIPAGNVRHEHEWRVWQQAKLPPGKMLMPGVVSRASAIEGCGLLYLLE